MKIIRQSPPAKQATRPIKSFDAPKPAPAPPAHPKVRASNDLAAEAVSMASDGTRSIDPRQQRF